MKARLVAVVVVVAALVPFVAEAQEAPAGALVSAEAKVYKGRERAIFSEVYCSGFVSSTRLESTLRVIAGEDHIGRIVHAAGDYVYLSHGTDIEMEPGNEYLVIRRVKDPFVTQAFGGQNGMLKRAGRLYQDVGRVRVHVADETTATAEVLYLCDSMHNGDLLVPFEERPVPEYRPSARFDQFAPWTGSEFGSLLAGRDFPHMIGAGEAIYIDLGTETGVKPGDYVRIFRSPRGPRAEIGKRGGEGSVRGYGGGIMFKSPGRKDLPWEVRGEAMVIWADAYSATAIITNALGEIHPGDYIEGPPPPPPPAPTATLTAEPNTIARGQAVMLSWSTENATEVELSPDIGPVDTTGTFTVEPTETTTYRLIVIGPSGRIEVEATVTVTEGAPAVPPTAPPAVAPTVAPPTASVTLEPTTISRGQSAVLSWSTENASSQEFPEWGAVESQGAYTVDPSETTTYRLIVRGPGGQIEVTATLSVTEAARAVRPTATLAVEPTTIARGQSAVLSWSAQNATEVELDPFGAVEAEGAYTVDPSETTTYRLIVRGPGGKTEVKVKLTVTEAPPMPPTGTLTVEPTVIERGQSAVLSWSADNATEVELDPFGKVESQGAYTVEPTETTTYRLIVKGPGGATEVKVTLTVTQPPPEAPTARH